ncbi:AraC family transcriptional regulator [Variovorax humicola]|uniref:AraC family transcriptional regulator n=1 Tax=Variovorax humicola TaxID=1769758 RepID=A0ABU8VVM6_9BURK
MDALSEVLSNCRAQRAVTAHFKLTGPWALHSAGVSGVMIRMSRGAPWWLQLDGAAPVRVDAGDLTMLPMGAPHLVASELGAPVHAFARLIAQHAEGPKDENPLVFSHGGDGGALTEMFSVLMWFPAYTRHSVFGILPPLIHIRERELPLAGCLATTMQSLIVETLARRPGWRVSAARMGELLLVNILRERLGKATVQDAGWLRGLTDPAIARALTRIHLEPRKKWTVELLAREAAMSRSSFSERFKDLMDTTPIGYLTDHRMALAAEQFETGNCRLAEIAETAGYESDKVFARAFRRWSGLTPTAYMKRESERGKVMADFAASMSQLP